MENLKRLRKKFDITQDDLAKILQVTKILIYHYEKGLRQPGLDRLMQLTEFFHCTMDYLLDRSSAIKVPVVPRPWWHLSYHAADTDKVRDYLTLELPVTEGQEYFCLQAGDEAMEPLIQPGDLLVLEACSAPDTTENTVFLVVTGRECLLKFVKKTDDGLLLFPTNTAKFTPRHYSAEEAYTQSCRILGKVIKIIRNTK